MRFRTLFLASLPALALGAGSAIAQPTGGGLAASLGQTGQGSLDALTQQGSFALTGSGLFEDVEPTGSFTSSLTRDAAAFSGTLTESDDTGSINGLLQPDRALLGLEGEGDETIDTDRDRAGIPN